MITLASTRFNTETWHERERWLEQNKWDGCILGSPIQIKPDIVGSMIVLEMHNNENRVKAISLIRNQVVVIDDKNYQIYKDRNYNRYIYKSRYRLIISEIEHSLTTTEKKIIAIFNQLLFKGACHCKRAQGITAVPSWIMQNKHIDFIKYFKAIFTRHYTKK